MSDTPTHDFVAISRRQVLLGGAAAAAALAFPAAASAASHAGAGRAAPVPGMHSITTKDGTEIFYKDWGKGQPIVFSHGWPLSSDDWDAQML
jgi:non-heme chloroperoxidase